MNAWFSADISVEIQQCMGVRIVQDNKYMNVLCRREPLVLLGDGDSPELVAALLCAACAVTRPIEFVLERWDDETLRAIAIAARHMGDRYQGCSAKFEDLSAWPRVVRTVPKLTLCHSISDPPGSFASLGAPSGSFAPLGAPSPSDPVRPEDVTHIDQFVICKKRGEEASRGWLDIMAACGGGVTFEVVVVGECAWSASDVEVLAGVHTLLCYKTLPTLLSPLPALRMLTTTLQDGLEAFLEMCPSLDGLDVGGCRPYPPLPLPLPQHIAASLKSLTITPWDHAEGIPALLRLCPDVEKVHVICPRDDASPILEALSACRAVSELTITRARCLAADVRVCLPSLRRLALHARDISDGGMRAILRLLAGSRLEQFELVSRRPEAEKEYDALAHAMPATLTDLRLEFGARGALPVFPMALLSARSPHLRRISIDKTYAEVYDGALAAMSALVEFRCWGWDDRAPSRINELRRRHRADLEAWRSAISGELPLPSLLRRIPWHFASIRHRVERFTGLGACEDIDMHPCAIEWFV